MLLCLTRYHVMTYDPMRYPDVMVEARRPSGCPGCLQTGSCAEISYPVAVLRQTANCDAEGFHEYEQGWHRLIVGFTCVATPEMSS